VNFSADPQAIETGEHGIAVKIDFAPVVGANEAVILLGGHPGDEAVRLEVGLFRLLAALADPLAQLPARSVEHIADRHICVLVRMILGRVPGGVDVYPARKL
jgi:hypothetical protein